MRFVKAALRAMVPDRILADRRKRRRTVLIQESGLFEAEWYLETNPDVREAGMNALDHYLAYGALERRSPGPNFDARWYQHAYPDAAAANEDLLFHYLVFGLKEGRLPTWPEPAAVSDTFDDLPEPLLNWALKHFESYKKSATRASLDEAVDRSSTVSFDIFDTLLTRLYPEPDDLLRQVEIILDQEFGTSTDFFSKRKSVEHELRRRLKPSEDVTYDQIYEGLQGWLKPDIVERATTLDFDLESRSLLRRDAVVDAFQRAVTKGKRVILVSDTYFTRGQIEQLLSARGIHGYSELYISSETGLRKDSGDVWNHLLDREQAAGPGFLHIGDNAHSDFELPRALGIHAFYLLSPINLYRLSLVAKFTPKDRLAQIPLAMGPVIARHFNSPFETVELLEPPPNPG